MFGFNFAEHFHPAALDCAEIVRFRMFRRMLANVDVHMPIFGVAVIGRLRRPPSVESEQVIVSDAVML